MIDLNEICLKFINLLTPEYKNHLIYSELCNNDVYLHEFRYNLDVVNRIVITNNYVFNQCYG